MSIPQFTLLPFILTHSNIAFSFICVLLFIFYFKNTLEKALHHHASDIENIKQFLHRKQSWWKKCIHSDKLFNLELSGFSLTRCSQGKKQQKKPQLLAMQHLPKKDDPAQMSLQSMPASHLEKRIQCPKGNMGWAEEKAWLVTNCQGNRSQAIDELCKHLITLCREHRSTTPRPYGNRLDISYKGSS